GEQLPGLFGGQTFAIERDRDLEVQERVLAKTPRRPAADGRGDLRARGPFRAPRGRNSNYHPRGFERRNVVEQLIGFGRRPAQWMKDLPRLDHRLEPDATVRRALDRQEQG